MVKRIVLLTFLLVSVCYSQMVSEQGKSEAKEVTVKKSFGKVNMELFCGVVRPYEIKVPDPFYALLETKKGYTTKISYLRLTLTLGKKRLFIEAEKGLANKDYSKLELKDLKKVENNGFILPQNAHTLIVKIKNNNVSIDRVN